MSSASISQPPTLYVIAGPNGSGKSTFTLALSSLSAFPVIDPDAVARTLRPDTPEAAMIEAGRLVIERAHDLLHQNLSFAIETTLAGRLQLRLMREVKGKHYRVEFIYVCVESPDINIARVAQRVAQGGHHVPAADVRRRYHRSLDNLRNAIQIADASTLYNNSTLQGHRKVIEFAHAQVTFQTTPLPQWVTTSIGALLTPPSSLSDTPDTP